MTPAELGRLCSGMPNLTWLDLTGGETMLRPDIEELLEEILAATPRLAVLHFPTNGSFPTRAVACAELVRRRRPELSLLLTVSIDGPEALHDKMRGREGSYRSALNTFERLREIPGVEVWLGTTVLPSNVDALDELESALRRDVRDWHPGLWHWNLGQVSEHFFGNQDVSVQVDPTRAAGLVRQQFARRWPPRSPVDLMELSFLSLLPNYLEGRGTGLTCPSLHSTCFVSADASLYPCHVWDRPLANLRDWDFNVTAVWGSKDVLEAREEVQKLDCGDCFTPCEAYPRLAASPLRGPLALLRSRLNSGNAQPWGS